MNERDLIEQLKSLRSIEPESGYAHISRASILTYPKKETLMQRMLQSTVKQAFAFGFSIALVAVFLLLASTSTSLFHPLSQPNLSSIDGTYLETEADEVTNSIDIYLAEAAYYDTAAEATTVALNEVTVSGPEHTSPVLIKNEMDRLSMDPEEEKANVDALLDEVIL